MIYDLTHLSFASALVALTILALLATLALRRRLAIAVVSARDFGQRLGKRKLILQLLILIGVGSVVAWAEVGHWPSADLIVKQGLAMACCLLLSQWAAYAGETIGKGMMLTSLGVRSLVIIGGAINIATAPSSHTMGLVMAITMTLAAAFMPEDLARLRNWRNATQPDSR